MTLYQWTVESFDHGLFAAWSWSLVFSRTRSHLNIANVIKYTTRAGPHPLLSTVLGPRRTGVPPSGTLPVLALGLGLGPGWARVVACLAGTPRRAAAVALPLPCRAAPLWSGLGAVQPPRPDALRTARLGLQRASVGDATRTFVIPTPTCQSSACHTIMMCVISCRAEIVRGRMMTDRKGDRTRRDTRQHTRRPWL